MAGERTPDTNIHPAGAKFVNGSSDDDISLREHLQRQLDATHREFDRLLGDQAGLFDRVIIDLRTLLDERYLTQVKAIEKAEMATEKRFEGVNEFRDQLRDQALTFMPRSEAEVRIIALTERSDVNANQIIATAAIQSERINKLELSINTRLAASDGKGAGLNAAWGYLVAAIGVVGGLVGLIIGLR